MNAQQVTDVIYEALILYMQDGPSAIEEVSADPSSGLVSHLRIRTADQSEYILSVRSREAGLHLVTGTGL